MPDSFIVFDLTLLVCIQGALPGQFSKRSHVGNILRTKLDYE